MCSTKGFGWMDRPKKKRKKKNGDSFLFFPILVQIETSGMCECGWMGGWVAFDLDKTL